MAFRLKMESVLQSIGGALLGTVADRRDLGRRPGGRPLPRAARRVGRAEDSRTDRLK